MRRTIVLGVFGLIVFCASCGKPADEKSWPLHPPVDASAVSNLLKVDSVERLPSEERLVIQVTAEAPCTVQLRWRMEGRFVTRDLAVEPDAEGKAALNVNDFAIDPASTIVITPAGE